MGMLLERAEVALEPAESGAEVFAARRVELSLPLLLVKHDARRLRA